MFSQIHKISWHFTTKNATESKHIKASHVAREKKWRKKTSDQPAHPHSLIIFFPARIWIYGSKGMYTSNSEYSGEYARLCRLISGLLVWVSCRILVSQVSHVLFNKKKYQTRNRNLMNNDIDSCKNWWLALNNWSKQVLLEPKHDKYCTSRHMRTSIAQTNLCFWRISKESLSLQNIMITIHVKFRENQTTNMHKLIWAFTVCKCWSWSVFPFFFSYIYSSKVSDAATLTVNDALKK